jgi:hypothetical protein
VELLLVRLDHVCSKVDGSFSVCNGFSLKPSSRQELGILIRFYCTLHRPYKLYLSYMHSHMFLNLYS